MSRTQEPYRPSFLFGNPLRMILPRGSNLSPKLQALLNTFEATLAERLRKVKPKDAEDVLSLSWMKFAMESLNNTHNDIKILITALELPVSDWDEKWIDVYLNNSVKLLDLCNAFSSEISRLNQGHLFLQCGLHRLNTTTSNQFEHARSSLDSWRQHISSKNQRLEKCFTILDGLKETLDLPKIKNSARGKVLMRAMYGVRVVTVFISSIFAATFSCSAEKVMDLRVSETYLWAEAFTDLQSYANLELRNTFFSQRVTVVKELEDVDNSLKNLYRMAQDGVSPADVEAFQSSVLDLGTRADKLSQGLDVLAKEVNDFFQIVLSGRDALLCNLRVGSNLSNNVQENNNVVGQVVL